MIRDCMLAKLDSLVPMVILFVSVSSSPSLAQSDAKKTPSPEVRALFRQATLKAREGDPKEAARLYELAYERYPHPDILFNIAASKAEVPNNCRRAHAAYERFIAACKKCRNRTLGLRRLELLEDQCRVQVVVRSEPMGAEVLVDGQRRGQTPITFRAWPGMLKLSLRKSGYAALEETLTVVEATPMVQSYDLQPFGRLRFVNLANEVSVVLDGRSVGAEGLVGIQRKVGMHKLALTDPDGRSFVKFVEVRRGEESVIDVGGALELFYQQGRPKGTVAVFWSSVGVAVVGAAVGTTFAVLQGATISDRDATNDPIEFNDLQNTVDRQGLASAIAFSAAGAGAMVALSAWLWPTLTEGGDPLYW